MKVAFLFGNGFDIQSGLKTNYTSFYEYILKEKYGFDIELDSVDNYELEEQTKNIDNLIYKEIALSKDNINTWADLEVQLGLLTYKINPEEGQKFLDDFIDLNIDLSDYLEMQQLDETDDIGDTSNLVEHMLNNFHSELRPKELGRVKKLLLKPGSINVNFISFNYTNTLSLILKKCNAKVFKNQFNKNYNMVLPKSVIHAHGRIGNMPTLGLNDESQFNSEIFDKEEVMHLMKPKSLDLNREVFKSDTINALKDSSIINVFGMSVGVTDKYWWNQIAEVLLGNSERILIIHEYSDMPNSNSSLQVSRKRRIIENKFLQNLEIETKQKAKLKNQILVCYRNEHMLNMDFKSLNRTENNKLKQTI